MKTDLEKDMAQGSRYTWGPITHVHRIGPYALIEYHPHLYNGCVETDAVDHTRTIYSVYVDGKSMRRSAATLEEGIALAMQCKHDEYGGNGQAARYFCAMIGVKKDLK